MVDSLKKRNKILILVPSFTAKGGIANYFKVLENQFSLNVEYFIRGARTWPDRKNIFFEFKRALKDLYDFVSMIRSGQYCLVQTSTSLGSLAVIRDGLFIFFAKFYKVKVIVFFRGWKIDFEKEMERKYLFFFKWIYFRSDAMIVLAKYIKNKLYFWGYKKNIYLETTVVDENLLANLNAEDIFEKYDKLQNSINILFLSRIEIPKGIYESVEAYRKVKLKYPSLSLTIAGEGSKLENIKKYIEKENVQDVTFLGYVRGQYKAKAFQNSTIFILPTYHGEGMPNSLLEAMAFGLPVITRPVGGVSDFFKNGKNGFMSESKDPKIFAQLIERLLNDKDLMINISMGNFHQARESFTTTKVVKRLEKIYSEFI